MKKKNTALAGALLLVLAGWSAADAAEIYTLDPIIVTAERTDTKELKTPAAVEIITDKQIRDYTPYKSFKSQFFTDLNFSYQANENARFFLNIDNLFNRHDIISSSSSTFYNLGRNFLAGVEYKF